MSISTNANPVSDDNLFNFNRTSFASLCKVVHYVRKFINNCKSRVGRRLSNFPMVSFDTSFADTTAFVIREAQKRAFPEVVEYFASPTKNKTPEIVKQLNLFSDSKSIIRVKIKFKNLNAPWSERNPILLGKNCSLSACIITEMHRNLKHAGVYKILFALRKEFWVPSAFHTVKKLIKPCIFCKKLFGRTVQLNQSNYRDVRINPTKIAYRDVSLDHIGSYQVRDDSGNKIKVYILIVTCMWSRAVNLLLCRRIDNKSFLLALQTHIHEYGIMQTILSDNGSPIVSSINQIKSFMNDARTKNFLTERNIRVLEFNPYPAGASFLGGTVESLVKQTKNMISTSISKNVLPIEQFCFLLSECRLLINKRPIACKKVLTDPMNDLSLTAITPEQLVKGYDVPAIAVVPHLHCDDDRVDDLTVRYETADTLYHDLENLRRVRSRLNEVYYDEFLQNLRDLSMYNSDYSAKKHVELSVGDLVLIKQRFCKPFYCPMGIVTEVECNDLCEVVSVTIRKSNKEIVRRHVTDVVLLEKCNVSSSNNVEVLPTSRPSRPSRLAALSCNDRNSKLAAHGLV